MIFHVTRGLKWMIFHVTRGQHSQQVKVKEETITELETKVRHLRDELHEERDKYSGKVCHSHVTLKQWHLFHFFLF